MRVISYKNQCIDFLQKPSPRPSPSGRGSFAIGSNDKLKGFAYVLFAVIIWSGWTVISRFAVKWNLSPYDVTAIRFTTAGIILLPVLIKKGFAISGHNVRDSLVMSLLMGAGFVNIATMGMLFAPVSHISTTLNGTTAILTTIAGIFLLGERFSRSQFSGIVITVTGLVVIFTAKEASAPDIHLGHALFITAASMWAAYIYLVKKWKVEALHSAAIVSVFSMFYYMPFYLIFADKSHINIENWQPILFQAFYQGVLTAILALFLFNKGLLIIGAARAGAMIPLVPVLSTMLAVVILQETPSFVELSGVLIVSIGVLLSSGILKKS